MELNGMKQWLETIKGYKERSARDVLNRIKRVKKLTNISLDSPYDQIINSLEDNEEFKQLSVYVKSHLRTAIKYYKEFSSIK